MFVRLRFTVLLSLLSVNSVLADEAMAWLDRMSHSFRELNYQGTFSYQRGDRIQSLRITHAMIDGEEYEHLEHLDGDRRGVIRRGREVNCVQPGRRLVRAFSYVASGEQGNAGTAAVAAFYDVVLTGRDRVAGHEAVNLTVTPKDAYRYGYRLSLEGDSGLLLRAELIGDQAQVLERFQFVELDIGGDIPLSHFDDVADGYNDNPAALNAATLVKEKPANKNPLAVDSQRWQVGWLPQGFVVTPLRVGRRGSEMMTFTDGLAVFSVFLEAVENTADTFAVKEGQTRKGATTAFFTTLNLNGHPHRVTVIGEIPQLTARQVAESVVLTVVQ